MSFAAGLRVSAAEIWEAQHAHPFVRGIGDGTLEEERFRWYVRQDYLFLIDYGRLLAMGAARAPRLEWMRRLAGLAGEVLGTEMELHRSFARRWGVSEAALEAETWAPTTRAYTDFLLRTASLGDFDELVAALLPCMWAYSEIGERLGARGLPDHAGYREWIEMYASAEFAELAAWCRGLTDAVAEGRDAGGRERMREAFVISSRHELAFWQAAWESSPGGVSRPVV